MTKPEIQIHIIEARDLFDPKTYWKKYNRFSSYCIVSFQGIKKRTKDTTIEEKSSSPLPPWNESFSFTVDGKKLTLPLNLHVEVYQKKFKEYWESNKDIILGQFDLSVDNIPDNQLYDSWITLPKGSLHISVLKKDLIPLTQPKIFPQQPMQENFQNVNPGVYQEKVLSTSQNYPQLNHGVLLSYDTTVNPQYSSQLPPQPVNLYPSLGIQPTSPTVPFPYLLSVQQTVKPQPTAPSIQPTAPPIQSNTPLLPLKVTFPSEIIQNIIVACTIKSTQPVSDKVLNDYFKFCGTITHFLKDKNGPYAIICFSKTYEADTALFLDNGIVCGGPIDVFRYKDIVSRISESNRSSIEKLAKQFSEQINSNPQSKVEITTDKPESNIEERDRVNIIESTSQRVFVKNLSKQAKVEVVLDFFSYCGIVSKLNLYKESPETQCAVVQFSTKDAATTALMLSGAFIYDKPIQVEQFTEQKEDYLRGQTIIETSSSASTNLAPQSSSKSSVVASLLAAGYNVGSNVVYQAKTYDENHYKIYQKVTQKWKDVDSKYDVSTKLEKGKEAVLSGVKGVFGKAQLLTGIKSEKNEKDSKEYS